VRKSAPFDGEEDLARRAGLEQHEMTLYAGADPLMSPAGHRRQQVWEASALRSTPHLLREAPVHEEHLELPEAPEDEEVVWDCAATELTLRQHPLAILRPTLAKLGWRTAEELHDLPSGRPVSACGFVTVRQQSETAHDTMFVSLEDETGSGQVIVWPNLMEQLRGLLLRSKLMAVEGTGQCESDERNLIAGHREDLTPLLGRLATASRDFYSPLRRSETCPSWWPAGDLPSDVVKSRTSQQNTMSAAAADRSTATIASSDSISGLSSESRKSPCSGPSQEERNASS